jgi:hypothetical protein
MAKSCGSTIENTHMKLRLALISAAVVLCGAIRASGYTDHTVDLTIHSISGSIGWHFSIYGGHSNNFGGSLFKKFRKRDDSHGSSRMNPGETWHDTWTVPGPATYVLDFSDWDNNPEVEVKLVIDGVQRLYAHGKGANLKNWNPQFGPGAHQTDDRETAINLN